jgi:hypothetical protein
MLISSIPNGNQRRSYTKDVPIKSSRICRSFHGDLCESWTMLVRISSTVENKSSGITDYGTLENFFKTRLTVFLLVLA